MSVNKLTNPQLVCQHRACSISLMKTKLMGNQDLRLESRTEALTAEITRRHLRVNT